MLNPNHLKYFNDAVETGSLAAAAKRNLVTPSTISQAIKQLELHFEVDLLVHKKNEFRLSDQGYFFYRHSRPVLTSIEKLEFQMSRTKTSPSGTLNFATQQSIALTIFPEALRMLRERHPDISTNFRMGTTNLVRGWLEDGIIDFAITLDHGFRSGFKKVSIFDGEFVLVGSPDLAPKSQHRFLVTMDTPETRQLKKLYREKFSTDLPVEAQVNSWGVIKNLSEKGLGIGFIPDYFLKFDAAEPLRIRGFAPRVSYSMCLVHHGNQPMTPAISAFLEVLREVLA